MKTLIIGSAIVDIMMKVENLPQRSGDVVSKERAISVGGCAYNVANTFKLLNQDCSLFVPIGQGVFGSIIEEQLIKDNYEILLKKDYKDNGYCIALIEPDGERTFITYSGLEDDFEKEWFNNINLNEYENIYFEGYKAYSSGGEKIVNRLAKLSKKNIYFCPGPMITSINKRLMKKVMSLNPILHLNEKEIIDYTNIKNLDEAIKSLYLQNRNVIYVTLGSNGVICYDGKTLVRVDGIKVKKVKDTLGAGDAHIATIMLSLSNGKTMENSLKLANLVASKIVEVQGAKIEDVKVIKYLREQYEKY
ncbi:PfkB family carbohydrate kinase [Spiroplasma endosymbiont of Cantharis rufa]|uniref:PfkB family carbohydrate kinase n=1 Tax=Spiroplasma endosymbiont of Cantharis rufa TaxID=3066279 RepID=UPI0030CB9A0D